MIEGKIDETDDDKEANSSGSQAVPHRDTLSDWQLIGRLEPYHGVLSNEKFLRQNLDDQALQEFWSSGRSDIQQFAEIMKQAFRFPFNPETALDFGCGVGRLTRAIAEMVGQVVGFDISAGMLSEARRYQLPNIEYTDVFPNTMFDWINSHIVFQHIPPLRGYQLFSELLDRLAPGGFFSVHVTIFRDNRFLPATVEGVQDSIWDGNMLRVLSEHRRPVGTMLMYDYDLSYLLCTAIRHGVNSFHAQHTDHGGCHGVILFGHKDSA